MSRDFTYVDGIDNPAKGIGTSNLFEEKDSLKQVSSSQEENLPADKSTAPYNNAPVQLLEKSIGIDAKKNFMDMQDGDVVSTYADTSDLMKDFGYKVS